MANSGRNTSALTPGQWTAVGTATAVVTTVAGPIGGALTAIGAAGGCYAANVMRWEQEGQSPSGQD